MPRRPVGDRRLRLSPLPVPGGPWLLGRQPPRHPAGRRGGGPVDRLPGARGAVRPLRAAGRPGPDPPRRHHRRAFPGRSRRRRPAGRDPAGPAVVKGRDPRPRGGTDGQPGGTGTGGIGPVTEDDERENPDDEGPAERSLTGEERDDFEKLLDYLKRNRGFDFTGYKRASLVRRVSARMKAVGAETFSGYLDLLQGDPDEFTALFDTILINLTASFRDPAAWDHLRSEVLPGLLAAKDPDDPIRLWSAGCASGEEAYTLAIALAEHLGADEMRRRVKIYGTDVDEDALTIARHATYTPKALSAV